MVDILKINKPLSSLSATKRVKSVGHRQNNNQQNLFKEAFKERRRKKKSKKNLEHIRISGRDVTVGRVQQSGHAITKKRSNEYSHRKIIDLRV
jgi:hypothetical protein